MSSDIANQIAKDAKLSLKVDLWNGISIPVLLPAWRSIGSCRSRTAQS
jgi:hypothetical protein